jgi:hypothetical protein
MEKGMIKQVLSLLIILFILPFVSAIICNPNLPNGCPSEIQSSSVTIINQFNSTNASSNYSLFSNYSYDSDKLDNQHGSYYTGYCDSKLTNYWNSSQILNGTLALNSSLGNYYTKSEVFNNTAFNATQMSNSGGVLNILVSWVWGTISSRVPKGWFTDLDSNTINATNMTATRFTSSGFLINNNINSPIAGNITNATYITMYEKSGACNLNINHSICSNATGTYIIG